MYGNLLDNVETQTEKRLFYPRLENHALNLRHCNSVGIWTGPCTMEWYKCYVGSTRHGKGEWVAYKHISMASVDRMSWDGTPAPLFTGRMTLGKLLRLWDSVPSPKVEIIIPTLQGCRVVRRMGPLDS